MACEEFRQTVRVDKDHRIVLSVPEVAVGTEVQVTIQHSAKSIRRRPGSAAGMFKIEKGFDDLIEGFEDYR